MKQILILLALLGTGLARADATLLLQQPALSADSLAFVYAGDIWVALRDGSEPRRLTSSPAVENRPVFSPDGGLIAFAASYEGNQDIYVIPVTGGQPRRLTWHPGDDIPTGWTPAGDAVTMVSRRETDHGRSGQWYHVALDGSSPVKQMEARVYRGRYDRDATQLAYIAYNSGYNGLFGGSAGWKGYRGGTTPAVRIMDLKKQSVITVDGAGATNFNPFWLAGQLYFLSDRERVTFQLFRYDPDSGRLKQLTDEAVWDIRAADGHGSSIVYEAGGRLKQLDLDTGKTHEIRISIAPDLPLARPQWKDAGKTIQNVEFSPTGKRALITARGDVFTVPVEHGSIRNLTATGTRREYTALWSPDGENIAYIAETLEGQFLIVEDQHGGKAQQRFELGPHFYQLREWAGGENQRIVYDDNHLGLHVIDLKSGKSGKIATGTRREAVATAVSSDGQWLAFTQDQANYQRDLVVHNFSSGKTRVVTDGTVDATAPAFSPDGKYLYFAASTNAGPLKVGLNMSSQEQPFRAGLFALVLAADGASPLSPRAGDEDGTGEDAESEDDEDAPETAVTKIDLKDLNSRLVALPVAQRNYGNLAVGEDGNLYYLQFVQPGGSIEPPGQDGRAANTLWRFDFEEREASQVLEDVSAFELSADGKHLLLTSADQSLATAELGEELEPEPLALEGLRVRVDPQAEWEQIFNETWRMEKEYFYAANLHGLDWTAVYKRYRPLLDHVGSRADLNRLLVAMIAELAAGHNRVSGGDIYQGQATDTGLLGANLRIENDRYRLDKVYAGEAWNPHIKAPLAAPGNIAHSGEYILVINGVELTGEDNIFALLQGTVGQQLSLRVGPNANGRNARDIVVIPIESERLLRRWDWIEGNRRLVDKATNGRVGYVYLPNTAGAGYSYFNRMFFSQLDKEAMIIDERSNAGGQAADYLVEMLGRRHLSGWADRDGMIFNTPAGALHGPKLMLIDQDAGSGGDFLPYAFRQLNIGTLMGTRTWGGLIGIATNPQLMDGGRVTVPFFRFFDADNNWTIENQGVAPDIEVTLDPIATNRGQDSQLLAAIEEILRQLISFRSSVPMQAPSLPTEVGK